MKGIDETHQFILKSTLPTENLKIEEVSVPGYILHCLEKGKSETAGIFDGVTGENVLYRNFEQMSRGVASALVKLGFQKGETLIYTTDETSRLHVFLLGVWRANGIIRGCYPEDLGDSLLGRLQESSCRWVLCDAEVVSTMKGLLADFQWKVNIITFVNQSNDDVITAESCFIDNGAECPSLELKRDDIAAVFPTSGTTGRSKGVKITHERLLANIFSNKVDTNFEEKAEFLFHLGKATHVSALMNFKFIAQSSNIVRLRNVHYNPQDILETIRQYRPAEMTVNGLLMRKLLNYIKPGLEGLDSLKVFNLLGVSVPMSTIEALVNLPNSPNCNLLYGTTEALSIANGDVREMYEKIKAGATGKLSSGVSLTVRAEDGTIFGPKTHGELCVRSNHSCIGYFNNEKETADVFQSGWIRTGDVGFVDEDGYLYIVGRIKEVFKYRGNHISPLEIEQTLCSHKAVAEACVVGIDDPNGLGYIPKGFVVLQANDRHINPEEIIKHANGQLPDYMHIRGGLVFIDSLPTGPGGKVQRYLLN